MCISITRFPILNCLFLRWLVFWYCCCFSQPLRPKTCHTSALFCLFRFVSFRFALPINNNLKAVSTTCVPPKAPLYGCRHTSPVFPIFPMRDPPEKQIAAITQHAMQLGQRQAPYCRDWGWPPQTARTENFMSHLCHPKNSRKMPKK